MGSTPSTEQSILAFSYVLFKATIWWLVTSNLKMSTLNIDPVFITERLTGSCRDVHRAVGCKLQHELDPHDRNWLDWEILVIGLYRDSAQPPTSFHPKKLFHLASFVFSSLYKYPPLSFSICHIRNFSPESSSSFHVEVYPLHICVFSFPYSGRHEGSKRKLQRTQLSPHPEPFTNAIGKKDSSMSAKGQLLSFFSKQRH